MIWWLLYAASVIVSYVLQRVYIRLCNEWMYEPYAFLLFVCFLPIANMVVSAIFVVIGLCTRIAKRPRKYHPILWLYGIRGKDQERVVR